MPDHELIWPQVSPDGALVSFTSYQHTFEIRSRSLLAAAPGAE
jgi:hypothetical protein